MQFKRIPKTPFLGGVGNRLRRFRQAIGGELSLRSFCAKNGLSATLISSLENGQKTINLETVYDLAEKLGISPNYLIIGIGEAMLDDAAKLALKVGFGSGYEKEHLVALAQREARNDKTGIILQVEDAAEEFRRTEARKTKTRVSRSRPKGKN